ncbi:MAG: restriction endonuclease subunit S [Lentisphaeria bacterium]|nr:restriction endonuclease subunit S [Lentisphaeria bacterium]
MNNNNFCILSDKFQRITNKNSVGNTNVLTISAQHGLINQFEYYNHQYASENTSGYPLLYKGEFAYNKSYSDGYPWGATKRLERYESGVVSPLYICFAAKDGVCADFYSYYFESDHFYREIYKIAQEGARNHGLLNVSTEDFFKIQIANPPLEEQRRIADILGCCDRVIALKKELIAEKKKQKKALMQKLLNPDSGFRLPGFSGEWKEFELNELGETYSGLAGKTAKDFECGNSFFVPYLNIFENTIVDVNKLEQVDIKPHENQNLVRYGDIFFTTSSETPEEVGMSSVFLADVNNTYLNSFCFGFRLYDFETLLPFFAAYYLRSDYMRIILNKLAQGATRFNISKTLLMKSKIKIPSSTVEQQAIADILSAADKEINLLEQELAQQEQKKKSLMQLLLTRTVRV